MEAADGTDAPPPTFEEGCLSDPGAMLVSGMVFGGGPDCWGSPPSVVIGAASPRSSATEVLTSGALSTASFAPSRPGEVLRDDTSVSSMAIGEGARGGVSLSAISGGREFPSDNGVCGSSRGGLKGK